MMAERPDLRPIVDELFDEIVDLRRALHAQPELSFEEHATTATVRDQLRSLGLEEIPCPTETGAVFALNGAREGRTVMLRADIDALPVQEAAGLAFASTRDGVMHACGHDVHTAWLLGAARVLAARADDIAGRYVFLFQPAEEQISGAKAMIDGGVLDVIQADRVVGAHVISPMPSGMVAMRPGIAMSDAQALHFDITGGGGHAAMPGSGGDVIGALGDLVGSLKDVVDGMVYEGSGCVCSAGLVQAGTAMNVVPAAAVVQGTLRTFTPDQKQSAVRRLEDTCARIGEARGVEVAVRLTLHAPPVRNDPDATRVVRSAAVRCIGEQAVVSLPPATPSDDVSEFLARVAGCYFFVGGGRSDGASGAHHSPSFAVDEESLRVGTLVLAEAARDLAGETRA